MKQNLGHIQNLNLQAGQNWFAPTKEDYTLFRVLMEV